ncbi:MAG: hypothetical protein AB1529_07385 [Candidatus Micrarchaeota archaeon]
MAGSRISIGLHDGFRMVERRPLSNDLRERDLLEATKCHFDTRTSQHELGEMVREIGGLKADHDNNVGFQVYVALEKAGRVIQVGLPCITDSAGQKRFLDAANMKAGDMDAMLDHLPPDVNMIVVWRLDRGMSQDITLNDRSIIAPIGGQDQGADYSALDNKPCVSCGAGAAKKLDVVVGLLQIEIFGGEAEDPIRMSTLMAAPPTCWDCPAPAVAFQQPQYSSSPGQFALQQTDFALRISWIDTLKTAENAAIPDYQPPGAPPRENPAEALRCEKKQDAPADAIILIVFNDAAGGQPTAAKPPPAPGQAPPLRASELRLWRELYSDGMPPPPGFGIRIQPPRQAVPMAAAPESIPVRIRIFEPRREALMGEPLAIAHSTLPPAMAVRGKPRLEASPSPVSPVKSPKKLQNPSRAKPARAPAPMNAADKAPAKGRTRAQLSSQRQNHAAPRAPKPRADAAEKKEKRPPVREKAPVPQNARAGKRKPATAETRITPKKENRETRRRARAAERMPAVSGKSAQPRRELPRRMAEKPRAQKLSHYFMLDMLGLYRKTLTGRASARNSI